MKAFIFNSGVGSRLGKLTKDKPKALVKLKNGETILGRQLRLLRNAGIKEIVISTGYKAELIKEYCLKEFPELNFVFVHNPKYASTNSIYSMFLAENKFQDDFIIMHGDLVFDNSIINKLLEDEHPDLVCINTEIEKPKKDFKGRVVDGKLQKIDVDIFEDKDYALQPLYKLRFSTISQWMLRIKWMIKTGFDNVYAETAFNNALPHLDVRTFDYKDNFIEEIDTLEDYDRVAGAFMAYDYAQQKSYRGDYLVKLTKVLKENKFKRPFIVYSSAIYKNPEFFDELSSYEITKYNSFSSNPKYEEVVPGVELFKKNNCDVIIAIGGGSAIDVAKAIKLFSGLDSKKNYLEQDLVYVNTPLIAIPTTAGTGSEATRFSVIYYNDEKQSLTHDCIFPDISILDPEFLQTLPEYHRRSTILDAFCQAVESYWSVNATRESKIYSARAIHLFLSTYKHYLEGHPFVDDMVMKLAYLAGLAINITTTTAPHAMSYKLTSLTGIAHGHAVSLTLPYIYKYMFEEAKRTKNKKLCQTFEEIAKILRTTETKLLKKFVSMFAEFELEKPTVTEQELKELVNSVNEERLKNNPVLLDKVTIEAIYRNALTVV